MEGTSWVRAALLLILQYAACDDTCIPNPGTVEPTALKLKKKLLCGYDRRVKPKSLKSGWTIVNVELQVNYLTYDPGYNTLDVEAVVRLTWPDFSITWKPEDFDGMRFYSLDTNYIWLPDIGVQNAVTRGGYMSWGGTDCKLYYFGDVICEAQGMLSAHCITDMRHWPYDQHTCSIDLGSWMRTAYVLYTTEPIHHVSEISIGREGEWKLEKAESDIVYEFSQSLGLNYSGVRMDLTIRRNAESLVAIVVVPVFALAAMTYAALLLPPDMEERLVLLSISLLCYCMFLKYLTWIIPPNGAEAPLIVLLYRNSTIVTGVAIALTIMARLLMTSERVAPPWLTLMIAKLRSTPGASIMLPPEMPKTEVQTVVEEVEAPVENVDPRLPPGDGSEWRDTAVLLDRLTSIVMAIVFTALLFLGPTM